MKTARTISLLVLLAFGSAALPASAATLDRSVPALGTRIVGPDGVGAEVPSPGHWVQGVFDLVGGGAWQVFVQTGVDGRVTVARTAPWADRGLNVVAAASTNPCTDSSYSFIGGHWASTLAWVYNPLGTTPTVKKNDAEIALQDGTRNMVTAHNDCGRADAVSATESYLGRDKVAEPSIAGLFCAGLLDGKNAVAFVPDLPPPVLAATCNYGSGSVITESDIGFAQGWPWYAPKHPPASCIEGIDVESVMTHERGHSFGLGHVTEADHPLMTMSEATSPCDGSASTLGLGDMLGLEALY